MEIKVSLEIPDEVMPEFIQKAVDKRLMEIKQEGDFVIVTRCEKCKYFFDDCCNNPKNTVTYRVPDFGEHYVYKDGIKVDPDHFCRYAEPKEIEEYE